VRLVHLRSVDGVAVGSATSMDDSQEIYEIRIRGRLTETFLQAFEGMSASVKPAETVLHGPLADQRALHELLDRIHALGLELVDVRHLPHDTRTAGRDAP
jgi:hypothetical protein